MRLYGSGIALVFLGHIFCVLITVIVIMTTIMHITVRIFPRTNKQCVYIYIYIYVAVDIYIYIYIYRYRYSVWILVPRARKAVDAFGD